MCSFCKVRSHTFYGVIDWTMSKIAGQFSSYYDHNADVIIYVVGSSSEKLIFRTSSQQN